MVGILLASGRASPIVSLAAGGCLNGGLPGTHSGL